MLISHNHVTDDIPCPHCGMVRDHATGIETPDDPRAEDAAFCFTCGGWAIFTYEGGKLGQRLPTDDELIDLHLQPEVRLVEKAWLKQQGGTPKVGDQ